jgi:flagellar export protein FliJ
VKSFSFQLERVRNWRLQQLELETGKLQRLFSEQQAFASEFRRLESERLNTRASIISQASTRAEELAAVDAYNRHLTAEQGRVRSRQAECQKRIDEQRKALMCADQRFQVLARLKQKRHSEWKTAISREQESLASELYLSRRRSADVALEPGSPRTAGSAHCNMPGTRNPNEA